MSDGNQCCSSHFIISLPSAKKYVATSEDGIETVFSKFVSECTGYVMFLSDEDALIIHADLSTAALWGFENSLYFLSLLLDLKVFQFVQYFISFVMLILFVPHFCLFGMKQW